MIVYAAVVPHPAVSIPEIGKANTLNLTQTLEAFQHIRQELYASKAETIVIISPHVTAPTNVFSFNQHKEVAINFKDFGDLTPRRKINNNIGLAYQVRQTLETSMPTISHEAEMLDYGSSIPLYHLLEGLPNCKVMVIGTAPEQTLAQHFEFGRLIKRTLENSLERLAVIASADLSHNVSPDQEQKNAEFDASVLKLLEKQLTKEILAFQPAHTERVAECGLRPISMLLGLLDERAYTVRLISYQRYLGIGYCLAAYDIR